MNSAASVLGDRGLGGRVEVRAGDLRLALRADLGAAIAGLWHRRTPILRSTEPGDLAGARQSACYPLVPYSNRLAYQRFRWLGHDYTTATNFDDNPHSVHGVGWLRAWDVAVHRETDAVLRYRHVPDAHWPFAFEAQQAFTLTPRSLVVTLSITNTADIAQPVGLGWHPYFPKRDRSHLRIAVSDRWDSDETQLPVRKVVQPDIDAEVAGLRLDNCFDGWCGPAAISDGVFELRLSSNLTHLVVYTPVDKPYFCVEPVSHVSDAIHGDPPAALGLRTLLPGETFDASMTLEVTAL